MSFIERSIRQPVAVTVAVLLVVIFGLMGVYGIFEFLKLPVQLTPNVDQPEVTVTTRWFGASPQEMEREILEEQEEVLKTVGGLREMVSTAREGEGTVTLRFYVGVDKEAALNEVRDKLRQVPEYPEDADEPVVESVTSGSDNYIAWMVLRRTGEAAVAPEQTGIPGYSGEVQQLQDFMEDEVKPVLERVEGIASVNVLGGREREMQVRVDMQRLAARGISLSELSNALRRENINVTAGTIDEGKRQTSIRAVGQYEDRQALLDTVVAYTAAGAPVYVRDVADVELGFKKRIWFVRSLGQDVLVMNAKRETGSNIITVMKGLKEAIRSVNEEVLTPRKLGLEVWQLYDESDYVERSLDNARVDLLIGACLAAGVLFLTLRSIGATLAIAISIPISIVGTFLGMALAGRNLNVISMAGLTFSVGIGIDNAIVVLENIFRHREMGKGRIQAAIDGAREVWGAIVASILTNVAVFVPILFIEEEAGQLFRDIAVAITISMALYMAVSPTVIPMLAALFLRKMPGAYSVEGKAQRPQTLMGRLTSPLAHAGDSMARAFYASVYWLTGGWVRRIVLAGGMIVTAVVAGWLLIPPRTYLPPGNQNFVFAFLAPPPGYNLQEFARMGEQIESSLRPWWNVKPGSKELEQLRANWKQQMQQYVLPPMDQQLAGMRAGVAQMEQQLAQAPPQQRPAIRENRDKLKEMADQVDERIKAIKSANPPPIENFFFVAISGQAFMGASSAEPENVKPLEILLNASLQGIPGTFGIAEQAPIFRLGRTGGGSAIEINVSGNDYAQVRASAGILQGMLMQRFETFVRSDPLSFDVGRPEAQVIVNKVQAASAGVPAGLVRDVAQAATDGLIIGDYRLQGDKIDLVVKSGRATDEVGELRNVPVVTNDGRTVPLGSVASFVSTSAAQQILRVERQPAVTLVVPIAQGKTIQEVSQTIVNEVIEPLRAGGAIPPTVSTRLTGSADKLDSFMNAFIPGFILAAVVTYLLLAALFESWLYPLVIIMSVPFALVGGILGLAILHAFVPSALMDVLTMLGFVILIGVIVNNPILIVHQSLNYMAGGMDSQHAIAKSTQTRVRPIFMSVVTTVAATTPLVVLGGAGSELYRGLGAVMIGGLLLSTLFTLFLTPTLMSLAVDAKALLAQIVGRIFGKRVARPVEPVPSEPAMESALTRSPNGERA